MIFITKYSSGLAEKDFVYLGDHVYIFRSKYSFTKTNYLTFPFPFFFFQNRVPVLEKQENAIYIHSHIYICSHKC